MCTISFGEKEAVKNHRWPDHSTLTPCSLWSTLLLFLLLWHDGTPRSKVNTETKVCASLIFSSHGGFPLAMSLLKFTFNLSFFLSFFLLVPFSLLLYTYRAFVNISSLSLFFPMQSTLNLAFLCDWVLNVLHVNNVRVCSCLDDYKLFIPPSAPTQTNTISTATDCLHATVLPVCVYPSLLFCSLYLISYWEC